MKKIFIVLILIFYALNLYSNDEININFKDIKVDDLIKITSKITKKNILITQIINEKVDYIPTQKITKENLFDILETTLKEKGYFLVDENGVLKVKKIEIIKDEEQFTEVISLKNVDGVNIIKILDDIVNKKYINKPTKPFVSLDLESNSLVVMASKDELKQIKDLIQELDKEKAQVYVQAKIIEVNNELVNKIGISYGIISTSARSDGINAISSNLNGGSNAIKEAVDTLGIKVSDINIKSGLALGASLNLLQQNGALDIVSEPSILAIDNKESSIYVGEKISVEISSTLTDGGLQRINYEREDIGLTLKVKPRISSDTKLTLEINTLLEGIKSTSVSAGQNPDTLKKEIKTAAILNNGESVIIGGLIENKNETIEQKVPVLGDIPLFGELFKNDSKMNKKNNLVIIVTPYMIPKSKDITYIREQLSELKKLEDKYLQDSLSIIKDNSKKHKENIFVENNENDNKSEHEKRVKEILGY
ncbi:secretin N-terminal domain-containing protein [Aliarcobacter butzleri]|uniref:Secretin N-terminal domain-containing protein n=1 Tax=Aliarcobacter butzleri TaxID=28197 RepID=A0AAW7QC07_9BACT|nr:secretin N-terminal domain-containing protein [Aliarcobacter butzleri]MDN5107097.1 secretin N-terminal domain-containing protein [Aliarcobacter butzleri]MDN5123847.1 secretin N-terminal domain-containing protein [Aliarcobacter butzleri]